MDDILVHGKTEEIHGQRLAKVWEVIKAPGLKLNKAKCHFKEKQVCFLGHIINKTGVRTNPDKVTGIKNCPQTQNVTKLKKFPGMVNYLALFAGQSEATMAKGGRQQTS